MHLCALTFATVSGLFWLAVAVSPFVAWGLSRDRKADGTPVTGTSPLAVDSHGRPTSPSLVGDTRGAR